MFSIKKLKVLKLKLYFNLFKVKVIGVGDKLMYIIVDGKEKQFVLFGVVDKEDFIKVFLYEVDKLLLLKVGECVVLLNYVYRVDFYLIIVVIVVIRVMKILVFVVLEDVKLIVKVIVNFVLVKIITIYDVKKSFIKFLVLIKG